MYICICNAISDKKIHTAIDKGNCRVKDVYSACGASPQCGSCASDIKDMISKRKKSNMQLGMGD